MRYLPPRSHLMTMIAPHPHEAMDQAEQPLLAVVQRVITPDALAQSLSPARRPSQRHRKLPGELLCLLFVAMHLLPPTALDLVLATVLSGRRARDPGSTPSPASAS